VCWYFEGKKKNKIGVGSVFDVKEKLIDWDDDFDCSWAKSTGTYPICFVSALIFDFDKKHIFNGRFTSNSWKTRYYLL